MKEQQETVIQVRGMTCGACVRHVTKALTDVEGVTDVEVHRREGRVVVRHDSSVASLTEAVRAAGYDADSAVAELT
ncbi:MAG: heavy metal-associated domain-containing protein [Deltaproteobacteria bacterium]|nr:heavy metal-associated domain-containing protein [Deltaproteobacteria bacterium]